MPVLHVRSALFTPMRCNAVMNVNILDRDLLNKARAALLRRRRELSQRERQDAAELAHAQEPLSADSEEQAAEVQNFAALESTREAALAELAAVSRALERIDNGTYGECIVCGKNIDPRRLDVLPQAATCVSCAEAAPSG